MPEQYRQDQYAIQDWRAYNLAQPSRGYRWFCYDPTECVLVAIATGVVRETRYRDDREYQWRRRYSRTYGYNDDGYYRECHDRPDPAGTLLGGLIGGLIGQAAGGRHPAAATFTGIIIGSAVGTALMRDLDCDDRSYAYPAFYGALNSGRPGAVYRWNNPRGSHRGEFMVRGYYTDAAGFSCANYRNTSYVGRRVQMNGQACRQPDGAWVFLN